MADYSDMLIKKGLAKIPEPDYTGIQAEIKTPASHLNDPETSYIAEGNMNKSGKRVSNQKVIADYVKRYPGHTAAELGLHTGLGQIECSRRLSEINNVTVYRSTKRRCLVKGTQMMVWHPLYLTEQRELI